jgi:hypothetical protein
VDSASLAAASLLTALTRSAATLAAVGHPFARSTPFSHPAPPAGSAMGTVITLPDGREVRFAVWFGYADDAFHIEGEVVAEDEVLVGLPRTSTPDLGAALAALDHCTVEVTAPAGRILDRLLEDLR